MQKQRRRSKMGLFSDVALLGIGVAVGYYCCAQPRIESCPGAYRGEIQKLQEKYGDKIAKHGILGPDEVGIDYVIAEKDGFQGYLLTDNFSGKQGLLVRGKFGEQQVPMYFPLERKVTSLTERVSLIQEGEEPSTLGKVTSLSYWKNKMKGMVE